MNNWTASELAFRCDRLFVRMERLAQNFLQIASRLEISILAQAWAARI